MWRTRTRFFFVITLTTLLLVIPQIHLNRVFAHDKINTDTVYSNKALMLRPGEPTPSQLVTGTSNYKDIFLTEVKKYNTQLKAKRIAHQKAIARARRLAKQRAAIKTAQAAKPSFKPSIVYHPVSSGGNTYTLGNCTWGVKNWRPDIPNNWHNASNWLYAAQSAGWATGATPRLNAVAWLRGGNHVALVISLNPATIREMNYNGLYSIHTRVINVAEWAFIY